MPVLSWGRRALADAKTAGIMDIALFLGDFQPSLP